MASSTTSASAPVTDDYDLGTFKTPSLGNLKVRQPFMHGDRFETLNSP